MAYYKAARQYLRAVKRHLVCSGENRARLMRLTNRAVNACLDDEPNKPYAALVSAIGEPKAFAESLMDGISSDEVKRSRKKRRLRFCSALISFALVFAITFTGLARFYLKYQEAQGRFEGEVWTLAKPAWMTTEEFDEFSDYLRQKMRGEISQ